MGGGSGNPSVFVVFLEKRMEIRLFWHTRSFGWRKVGMEKDIFARNPPWRDCLVLGLLNLGPFEKQKSYASHTIWSQNQIVDFTPT